MSDWRLEFEVICENVLVGDANDLERHPDEDTCNCVDGDSCLDMKCSNYYRQNECNDSNCSSHSCCNRRLQMNLEAPIEVRPAGTKGWGCFATAKIKRGTLVKELVGEILSEKEYVRRLSEETNKGHAYIVEIKSKTFLDCTYKGSIARFINHSCEPNCETAIWCVNGRLRVGIFARKEIDINVELSFDYRWEASAKPPTRCYCGTKSCRGFLEVYVYTFCQLIYLMECLLDAYLLVGGCRELGTISTFWAMAPSPRFSNSCQRGKCGGSRTLAVRKED
jgi:hypothetical protein